MGKSKTFKDGLSKKQWRRVRRHSQRAACIVYGIYDFSGNLRYIGQSRQRPEDRLKWFYKNIDRKIARKQKLSPVEKWVDSQQFHGLEVLIKIIDQNATWDVSEVLYIERFRREGCDLLNVTRGGNDNISNLVREGLRY